MNGRRTDIAPNRCPVNDITVPDDGIDKESEASQACPSHVKTGSRIPGCVMPYFSFHMRSHTSQKSVNYLPIRCHRKGMQQRMNPTKENTENTQFGGACDMSTDVRNDLLL